jgi:hypothetical protein
VSGPAQQPGQKPQRPAAEFTLPRGTPGRFDSIPARRLLCGLPVFPGPDFQRIRRQFGDLPRAMEMGAANMAEAHRMRKKGVALRALVSGLSK